MEECWFVLKQSHYPPPQLPKNRFGIGIGNGAICLGHIIPDLTNLDGVINRNEEGVKFTPVTQVFHTEIWSRDWRRDMGLELELAAWTPTSAKRQTKLAFERTVKNYRDFDALDEYIIQVDKRFIRRILTDAVAARIEQIKGVRPLGLGDHWSVFMITGIIVARGAKGKSGEDEMVESPNATNVANSASIDVPASFANQNDASLSTEKTADFVWAVRLQKIWKGATEIDWNYRTVSKGAVAGIGHEKPWKDKFHSILSQELSAVGTFQAFDLSEEQGMIVCLDPYTPAARDRMSLTTNGCV